MGLRALIDSAQEMLPVVAPSARNGVPQQARRATVQFKRISLQAGIGALLACVPLSPVLAAAELEGGCGSLTGSFGPFDYRIALDRHAIVETYHFTRQVERLQSGQSASLGADIGYTLRAFPNHPRALLAMMRLGQRDKTERPVGSPYTVRCFFERAVRFTPDDGIVRALFGMYLARKGERAEAMDQLETASALAASDVNIHYNAGLAYLELSEFERALTHAHAAYRLGSPLPGLRDRLKSAGKWREDDMQSVGGAGERPAAPASRAP